MITRYIGEIFVIGDLLFDNLIALACILIKLVYQTLLQDGEDYV